MLILFIDYLDTPIQVNKKHVRECLQETLSDMYGSTMVTLSEDQQQLIVTIHDKKAVIDLESFVRLFLYKNLHFCHVFLFQF